MIKLAVRQVKSEEVQALKQAFKTATLPIDREHRRVTERVLDERVRLELLYECAAE